ncbi:palmitoyltransferase akr1 [Rhizophlyctis rosea]|nr:palmitoyltransferase akr1 [Rhizophlyctis rosea]
MLSEAREPLLSNFAEHVSAAASVVGNTVLSVASGETSLVSDKRSQHAHHVGKHHHYPPHLHGSAAEDEEDDSFAVKTMGRGTNLQEDALARAQDLDIFQAAQRGILERVTGLVESGEATPVDRDKENCTALHWAAINNHLTIARFLIDRGAEVDAFGGELMATPLHWASRSGHVQMVDYLRKKGADPSLKDNQGYNALHLAAHAGHTMMISYLLASGMDIDVGDNMGRTALMWSAYQGVSEDGMEELLKENASLEIVDQTGYTALHWAVDVFSEHLIKAGAKVDVKDPEGKTPRDWAKERGQLDTFDAIVKRHQWKKSANGHGPNGPNPFDKRTTNRIIYLIPFILIPFSFNLISTFRIYISIPLILFTIWLVQTQLVARYLLSGSMNMVTTPLMSAIIQGTLFWVFGTWIRVVPYTVSLLLEHILFLAFLGLCVHSFYKATVTDPGFIKQASGNDRRQTILKLAEDGSLNPRTYCITCSIRKPLRSKHFGAQNHRYFMLFIGSLVPGALLLVHIIFSYIGDNYPSTPSTTPSTCTLLTAPACAYITYDTFALCTAIWAGFQCFWVTFLLCMQSYQIATGKTTNEQANWFRFSYMVHPSDQGLPVYRRRMVNPFDLGVVGNCGEFWRGGGEFRDVNCHTSISFKEADGSTRHCSQSGRQTRDPQGVLKFCGSGADYMEKTLFVTDEEVVKHFFGKNAFPVEEAGVKRQAYVPPTEEETARKQARKQQIAEAFRKAREDPNNDIL